MLLFGGAVALQLTSAYTLLIAVLGFAASVTGWIVVPARGWRRCLAVGPGVLGVLSLLTGTEGAALVALTVAGWLIVRERPLASWIVLVIPIGVGVVLMATVTQYGQGVGVAFAVGIGVIASSALARLIARWSWARRDGRASGSDRDASSAQSE